jgi:hypothetical protein
LISCTFTKYIYDEEVRRYHAVVVFVRAVAIPQTKKPEPAASATVAALKQLEQDLGDAIIAIDVNKLNQIPADDSVELVGSGRILTKESFLRDLKSGKDKLESFEVGLWT